MSINEYYFHLKKKSIGVKEPRGYAGLTNETDCSYMNCIIQALLATQKLYYHVVLDPTKETLWAELSKLFIKMKYSLADKVNASNFYHYTFIPDQNARMESDPADYLRYVISLLRIHESIVPQYLSNDNYRNASYLSTDFSLPLENVVRNLYVQQPYLTPGSINNIFGGATLKKKKCIVCKHVSYEQKIITELLLSRPITYSSSCSVQTLINDYFRKIIITPFNNYCYVCGINTEVEQHKVLLTPPEHLIVILEDFRMFNITTYITNNIWVPTNKKPVLYEMYAAVIYSTYPVPNQFFTVATSGKKWYSFVDEVVTPIPDFGFDNLRWGCYPYIIFYKRSDLPDVSAPDMDQLLPRARRMLHKFNRKMLDDMWVSLGHQKLDVNYDSDEEDEENEE